MAYRTHAFINDAERAFGWLVDSGFAPAAVDDKPNLYAQVVYASPSVAVYVTWEVRDNYVAVDLGPLFGGAVPPAWPDTRDGRRVRYPLWLLAWVATGDEAFARSLGKNSRSRESIRQVLAQFSKLLNEQGHAILAGDLSVLPILDRADAQRIAANIEDKPWGRPPSGVAE